MVGICVLLFYPFLLAFDMGIIIGLGDEYDIKESNDFVWNEWKDLFWK